MASIVLDLVVPGAGTAFNALKMIAAMCSEMKEGQAMCRRFCQRLEDILTELTKMESNGTLPPSESLAKYPQILKSYLVFLQTYSRKSLVLRVATHHRMTGELKHLNEEVESLIRLLNLSMAGETMKWNKQWEDDRLAMTEALQAIAQNDEEILKEVRGTHAQQEAVMIATHKMQQVQQDQHGENHEDHHVTHELLKQVLVGVRRGSKTNYPTEVPEWYISPDEVTYDKEPFARGSFGAVHHGTWGSGTRVVIKSLLLEVELSDKTKQRFMDEINLWFKLHHPNIIKMYGASHVSLPPFIVCQDATNGNVAEYLELCKHRDGHQKYWALLLGAAHGLEYLHKHRVVHGDLKLNNILVASDGTACLADFGLSFVRTTTATLTAKAGTGAGAQGLTRQASSGALRWRAPECLRRRPTAASDIYSLAMCIIEAATGEPPFAFIDDDDTVYRLVKDGDIPEKPDELNDDGWELVQRMTKTDPKERLPIKQVIATMQRFAEADGVDRCSVSSAAATTVADVKLKIVETPRLTIDTRPVEVVEKPIAVEEVPYVSPSTPQPSKATATGSTSKRSDTPPPSPLPVVVSPARSPKPQSPAKTGKRPEVNESTSIPDLVDALANGSNATQDAAAKWLYRIAEYSGTHSDIERSDPEFEKLQMTAAGRSGVSYRGQLYAMACLVRIWQAQDKSLELEICLETVRNPTKADVDELVESFGTTLATALVETLEMVEILAGCKPSSCKALRDAGIVTKTVRLLRHKDSSVLTAVLRTIGNLVFYDRAAATEIADDSTVLPFLVELVGNGTEDHKTRAAKVIARLAEYDVLVPKVVTPAAIKPMVELLLSGTAQQRDDAITVIGRAIKGTSRAVVVKAGGIPALVYLLETGSDPQKKRATELLVSLVSRGLTHYEDYEDYEATINCVNSVIKLLSHADARAAVEFLYGLIDAAKNDPREFNFALQSLAQLLRSGTDQEKAHVLTILLKQAKHEDTRRMGLIAEDMMGALAEVLKSGSLDQKRDVARLMRWLTTDFSTAQRLCDSISAAEAGNAFAALPKADAEETQTSLTLGQMVLCSDRSRKTAVDKVDSNGLLVGRWASDLLCCCELESCTNVCMTFICPGVAVAQICHRLGMCSYSCVLVPFALLHILVITAMVVKNGYLTAVVVVFSLCIAASVAYMRCHIREQFDVPGSDVEDLCAAYFCGWCAIVQMGAHVESYKPGACSFGPRDTLYGYTS